MKYYISTKEPSLDKGKEKKNYGQEDNTFHIDH